MKILILAVFCIFLLSCKNTELANISYEITSMDIDTSVAAGERSDNTTPTVNPNPTPEPQPNTTSCLSLCKEKNHFNEIENDGFSYLSFPNFGYRGVGRCRGHAILTQKMTVLADFDPSDERCDIEETECLQKYRDAINNIRRFKAGTIPGFKNLLEFSSHPKIKPILRGIVAGFPNRYKAGPASIKEPVHETPELNHFYEVKYRLSKGHYPYIGVYGEQTGHHGLVAYVDTFKGSDNIICAKDPNVVLDSVENCDNYFYVKDGEIWYKRIGREEDKLTIFKLTGDEDDRVKKYKTALMQKCIEDSRAEELCK